MLVISESRSCRVVSMGGFIGVRNVSNNRGSTNAIFLTCAIYANSWCSSGRKTVVANGANNAGRNPPLSDAVCPCTSSGVPSPVVLVVRFLLVRCVYTRTEHLSDQRRRIPVLPFLALHFFVLFSIWRRRTCLFTLACESAPRPLLSTRQWWGTLQQFVRCPTQSAHEYEFDSPPSLQLTFQHASTLSTYQSMVFDWQNTCLFTRPDNARLAVTLIRHWFYTRPQFGRIYAHRMLLSLRLRRCRL